MNIRGKLLSVLLAIVMAAAMVGVGVMPAGAQPDEVWVDDGWVGSSAGASVGGHTFGTDAFASIQKGIDSVASGGVVHVAAGTYYENITLKDGVKVLGAGADVTIIDGYGAGSVVTAIDVGSDTILDGFTLINGAGSRTPPLNVVRGGGIYMRDSSPTLNNLIIRHNSARDGGGIYMDDSSPTVTNTIIAHNEASSRGGGICMWGSSPTLINVTIADNDASKGGGISCLVGSSPTIRNVILWGNGENLGGSGWAVTYSDVQGRVSGQGNIAANPKFVDAAGGDYHLLSDSPGIDAGTNEGAPTEDIEGKPRPVDGDGDGTAVADMGAYEYQADYEPPKPNEPPVAVIDEISPSPATEGEMVWFRGHGSDPDGFVTGYNWRSSKDGQLSTSRVFATQNLSKGTHTIFFKVQDNDGKWSPEVSQTLKIEEAPPTELPVAVIDEISPSPTKVGEMVWFRGHGTALDGFITEYNWRSSKDGQLSTSRIFATQSLTVGTHTIYFKVKDGDGKWSKEVSQTLEIRESQPPVAVIDEISPSSTKVGEMVWFRGHGSDPDGFVTGYNWRSSRDGQLSTSQVFVTQNLSKGTHTIYLKVQDNDGKWSPEVSQTLEIRESQPPVAVIDEISPSPTKVGEMVWFRGHGSDPDGFVTGYNWRSSRDGQLSTSQVFVTQNLSKGTHTIYLKVQDNDGKWSPEVSQTLEIRETQPPVAVIDEISPSPTKVGEMVWFSGHGSDPDGFVTGYNWRSSKDGQLSTSRIFVTQNLSKGTHTIYLKVQDNDGKWSLEVSQTLKVEAQE